MMIGKWYFLNSLPGRVRVSTPEKMRRTYVKKVDQLKEVEEASRSRNNF